MAPVVEILKWIFGGFLSARRSKSDRQRAVASELQPLLAAFPDAISAYIDSSLEGRAAAMKALWSLADKIDTVSTRLGDTALYHDIYLLTHEATRAIGAISSGDRDEYARIRRVDDERLSLIQTRLGTYFH